MDINTMARIFAESNSKFEALDRRFEELKEQHEAMNIRIEENNKTNKELLSELNALIDKM